MGAAKARKDRFLSEHPVCCFCGGTRKATTIDHVPNRAAFPGRHGPEGFEFPACSECQAAFRTEEHYFAFLVRVSDQDGANYDSQTSQRLIRGIRNNLPEMLPIVRLSSNEKRRAMRKMGLTLPPGTFYRELPLAAFPANSDEMIRKIAIKIGLALFYRQKGHSAPSHFDCCACWTPQSDLKKIAAWKEFAADFQGIEWGSRRNIEFGNRFRYGWSEEATGLPEIFMSIAEFGHSLAICTLIWDPALGPEVNRGPGTISVLAWAKKDFPENWLGSNRTRKS